MSETLIYSVMEIGLPDYETGYADTYDYYDDVQDALKKCDELNAMAEADGVDGELFFEVVVVRKEMLDE